MNYELTICSCLSLTNRLALSFWKPFVVFRVNLLFLMRNLVSVFSIVWSTMIHIALAHRYVDVHVRQKEQAAIRFQKPLYLAAVLENSTKVSTVAVVNVLGTSLNENIRFVIQNRSPQFTIGSTSGVVSTVGHLFDRELQDSYQLAVQVITSCQRSIGN